MKTTFKNYVAAVLGISTLITAAIFIGSFDEKGVPDPITIDGRTIEFTHTDDNTGEDLVLYTDRATYDQGFSQATVYVAVLNQSGKDQLVELSGYFKDNDRRVSDVSVLTTVTYPSHTPVYSRVCRTEPIVTPNKATTTGLAKTATTTEVCNQVQTSTTTETITQNRWVPLEKVTRDVAEFSKESQLVTEHQILRKSVDNYVSEDKAKGYLVPVDGTIYYKLNVQFLGNTDDNFFLEALGSEGGYGHLDPWFNASWLYRVAITVDDTKVPSTQTNFPVYVNLADLPADFHTNVKSDGCDIRVVEADQTTETPFELVNYSSSTDSGELHFKADSLTGSGGGDTTFYIYYGNSGASCYAVTDTYGRNAVWSDYYLVLHSQSNVDSTGNGRAGTDTSVSYGSGGQIAFAATYDGTNSRKQIGTFSRTNGDLTFSTWLKVNNYLTSTRIVWYDWKTVNNLLIYTNATGGGRIDVQWSGGSSINSGTLSTGTWRLFYAVREGTEGRLTVNAGSPTTKTGLTGIGSPSATIYVGEDEGGGSRISAAMDEMRYRAGVLSANWQTTEYNNQSSPSTFYAVSAQQTDTPAAVNKGGIIWFD